VTPAELQRLLSDLGLHLGKERNTPANVGKTPALVLCEALAKADTELLRLIDAYAQASFDCGLVRDAKDVDPADTTDLQKAARVAVHEALGTPAKEKWFMCGHPAWPDPLQRADARDAALAIRMYPHRNAYLVMYTQGPRREYKDERLIDFVRNNS
jgi:hypothetical protein